MFWKITASNLSPTGLVLNWVLANFKYVIMGIYHDNICIALPTHFWELNVSTLKKHAPWGLLYIYFKTTLKESEVEKMFPKT